MSYQNAIALQLATALKLWAPPPKLSLSQWAERYAFLSPESSAQPGKWHNIPYQVGILDALTDPSVEKVTVMKSARVGYTKIITNLIGYHIHNDPCNIMVVQPTVEDAEGYSKDEIRPMIRDTPVLKEIMPESKTRNSNNTILKKAYPGGTLMLIGANSGRGFRRVSSRIVIFDEVDGYPPSAGQEGDQIALGSRRADYFWNKKIVLGSTPTIKGISRIEENFQQSDQRHYYVPCPLCGHKQTLEWSNIDFSTKGTVKHPVYLCAECGEGIDYKYQRWMVENGEWRAHAESSGHAGFFIWAAYSYSPNSTWRHIVEAYLAAKDNPERLKTWVNTWLGQTWEEIGETIDHGELFGRREEYGICLPENSAVLTAAVDVQKDRLEVLTKCWGYDEESWDLEYVVLHGNTVQPEVWHQLDVFLQKTYPHMNGSQVGIHGTIIDTSYQPSPIVYEFIRQRQTRNIMGIKGSSTPTKPLIPPRASRRNKGKINLYEIGVSTGKDLLRARLQIPVLHESERNPGFIHFPLRFGQSFFQQLTAEKKILKYKKGRPYYEWVNVGKHRNEALDLEVYSIAALKLICPDVSMLNRLVDQARQKKSSNGEPKDSDKTAKRPARRKGGFVRNW